MYLINRVHWIWLRKFDDDDIDPKTCCRSGGVVKGGKSLHLSDLSLRP